MTDGALQILFSDLLNTIVPKKKYQVSAVFYETKSISHTIQVRRKHIQIKIANSFQQAPEHILKYLAVILYSKIFRYKIDSKIRREYKRFIEEAILPNHKIRSRRPNLKYKAQGEVYNLEYIFEDINRSYFQNHLKKPILGWSLNKSYTRLGFYAEDKNLLVISRILDAASVPLKVVEYMMYHEMLHIAIRTKILNGRRRVHPPEFKKLDRAFPNYAEIQKWINKNRRKL
jgi:hypothetical protein